MKKLSIQTNSTRRIQIKEVRRTFGNGRKVSLFTLGTMRALASEAQMYAVLKEACLAGINHIETAPAYGPAESFLGKALERLRKTGLQPKGGWVITSKLLPGVGLHEGKQQLKSILKRIGIKRVDNLAVHGLNRADHLDWAIKGDGADLFQWAKDKGLIGQIGFSSHGSFSLIEEAIESNRFKFCSLHLHLLDSKRLPLAKLALQKEMGVMAISPADKGGRLQEPSKTLIKDCAPISPLELAYRFLLAEGISTLTLGASIPEDLNLAKKLARAEEPLQEIEKRSIQNLHEASRERLGNTACEQCQACLPCPNNVPIPNILSLRNLLIGHHLEAFTKERYNLIGRAGHWWESINASACEKCGECIPRCPYNLPIPKLLEETHAKLVDSPRRRLWG